MGNKQIFLEEDDFFKSYSESITAKIKNLMFLPRAFLKKMSEFNYIVDMNVDNFKKKLKKMTFAELKQELHKLKSSKDDFERVLYANQINTGLLLIDCTDIKVYFR